MKMFLAAGDAVINPERLAYATVERGTGGCELRLNFGDAGGEVRLHGAEARAVFRWLKLKSIFLSHVDDFDAPKPIERREPASLGLSTDVDPSIHRQTAPLAKSCR